MPPGKPVSEIHHPNPVSVFMHPTCLLIDSADSFLSRSDRAAVERAIEQSDGQDVWVCCPSGSKIAIRYALAAGATQLVQPDRIPAGLLVCGLGGLGWNGELTAARLAIQQKARLVLEVLSFQRKGNRIEVLRNLERGARESLTISLPAVVVMSEVATTRNYVSQFRQQRIILAVGDRGSSAPAQTDLIWETVRPRTKTAGLAEKTSGGARARVFSTFGLSQVGTSQVGTDTLAGEDQKPLTDSEECAVHLLRYLAHHGFLESAPAELELDRDAEVAPTETSANLKAVPSRGDRQSAESEFQSRMSTATSPRRIRPQPLRLTPELFFSKLIRQPRIFRKLGPVAAPASAFEPAHSARFQRRPRPWSSTVSQRPQRGPFPYQGSSPGPTPTPKP